MPDLEPWEIALQQLRAEYTRLVPWRSPVELQDEVVWAYGRCEQTLQQWRKRQTMKEQEYDTYKQFGTCERESCPNQERELYVCYKCDKEVCYECGSNGRIVGEDFPVWLCLDCYPVTQHTTDCDCFQCEETHNQAAETLLLERNES